MTPYNEKEFASQRALAQYIEVSCAPNSCASVQLFALENEPNPESRNKLLRKTMRYLKESRARGLDFVPIDMSSLRFIVITDASFENKQEMMSQLGHVLLMADVKRHANIVHYGSNRGHRITRSVMVTEVHALVLAFRYGYVIHYALEEITKRTAHPEAYNDRQRFSMLLRRMTLPQRGGCKSIFFL